LQKSTAEQNKLEAPLGKLHRLPEILLGALILYVAYYHVAFSLYDGRALPDHDYFYTEAFRERYVADSFDHRWRALWRDWHDTQNYYPLVPFYLETVGLFCKMNLFAYRLANLPFFILLILGAYALTGRMTNKYWGLLAAFITATMPVLDNFSRKYTLHFQAASFLIWAFYLALIISQGRQRRGNFLWLGLAVGLAMDVHPAAVLQSLPIFVFLCLWPVFAAQKAPRYWPKLAGSVLTALITAWPVLRLFPQYWTEKSGRFIDSAESVMNWPMLSHHLRSAAGDVFYSYVGRYYFSVLLLAALVLAFNLRRIRDRESGFYLLLGAVVFYYVGALNAGISLASHHDYLILSVLLAPFLINEVYRLYQWIDRPPWSKVILVWLALLVLTTGTFEKNRPLARAALDQGGIYYFHYNDHRVLFFEKDLALQIIEAIHTMKRGDDVAVQIRQEGYTQTERPVWEAKLRAHSFLRMLAHMHDFDIENPQPGRKFHDEFEVVYYGFGALPKAREIAEILRRYQAVPNPATGNNVFWAVTEGELLTEPYPQYKFGMAIVKRISQ